MESGETVERVGWGLSDWVVAVGIARATYYNLPAATRPRSVRVGRRLILIEKPADWLRRMAESEVEAKGAKVGALPSHLNAGGCRRRSVTSNDTPDSPHRSESKEVSDEQ